MKDCGYCPFDEPDCDTCKIPEFTDDMYRDTCEICGDFIMMPYDTHDKFNLIVCKECAKKPAQEIYDEYCDSPHGHEAIGTFEGVYVEGTRKWW
jgi:hypothetical protein